MWLLPTPKQLTIYQVRLIRRLRDAYGTRPFTPIHAQTNRNDCDALVSLGLLEPVNCGVLAPWYQITNIGMMA